MSNRAAYSVREIMDIYGISRSTVHRLIKEQLVPSSKILGRRLIDAKGFAAAYRRGISYKPSAASNRDANRDAR